MKMKMKKQEKIDYLNNQRLFKDKNINWEDKILKKIDILNKSKGVIIKEGDFSSDIYFIFKGKVNVFVKGKKIATRTAGEYIGEISAVHKSIERTATCIATGKTILAKMTSEDFHNILETNYKLYKEMLFIAYERLYQRNDLIKKNNRKIPNLFVASSTEGKKIMDEIVKKFNKNIVNIKQWNIDTFKPSETSIRSLENTINDCDFGLVVFTPDDKGLIRGKNFIIPRDNLIFELGLLFGSLNRERIFYILTNQNIKIPTDLNGVTYLTLNNCYKTLSQIIKEKGVIKNV